jgi:hypothetical protein
MPQRQGTPSWRGKSPPIAVSPHCPWCCAFPWSAAMHLGVRYFHFAHARRAEANVFVPSDGHPLRALLRCGLVFGHHTQVSHRHRALLPLILAVYQSTVRTFDAIRFRLGMRPREPGPAWHHPTAWRHGGRMDLTLGGAVASGFKHRRHSAHANVDKLEKGRYTGCTTSGNAPVALGGLQAGAHTQKPDTARSLACSGRALPFPLPRRGHLAWVLGVSWRNGYGVEIPLPC